MGSLVVLRVQVAQKSVQKTIKTIRVSGGHKETSSNSQNVVYSSVW